MRFYPPTGGPFPLKRVKAPGERKVDGKAKRGIGQWTFSAGLALPILL